MMDVVLTREQVRSVDKLALERYHISGLVLMENAGHNAAAIVHNLYGDVGKALICCGPGNNGGDGCVIARHLHNAGWSVVVLIAGDADRMTPDTRANYAIVEAMGLDRTTTSDLDAQKGVVEAVERNRIIVDALLGTGFHGSVRSPTAELIESINQTKRHAVVAIDVPSGLDCDTGTPSNATIRADLTISLVARKFGFTAPGAAPYLGRVEVADIGAPRELIAQVVSG